MIAYNRLPIADCNRRPLKIALLVACLATPLFATPLDDKVKAFKNADTQPEPMVAELLKLGLQENRAAEALALVRPWLSANTAKSQALYFYAGRSMHYAGDWSDAVVFYRKLLKSRGISSKLAATVVPATYRLLINDMRDTESAYLFMREDGNRLRQYGRAKQFDRWFLNKAFERGDMRAVADRLTVIYRTAGEDPSGYDAYMDRLGKALETFAKRDDATAAALDQLAAAVATRRPKFKTRWDWVKAAAIYNSEAVALVSKRKAIPKELLAEPMKAASALIAADPVGGASLVVKGWIQYNQSHSPAFYDYARAHRDLKAEPFIRALQRLSPADAKRLLNAGANGPRGRRVSVASFIAPKQARALVPRLPIIFNVIDAPGVELWDKDITVAEAKALAPHIASNPHPHAALVRAFAACGEKSVTALVDAMMKSERWRFSEDKKQSNARRIVDTAWNCGADRKGADHKKLTAQYGAKGARYDQIKKQIGKDADSKNRMTAFNSLYQELRGGNPSTPALMGLWEELLRTAPNSDKSKILQKLAGDFHSAPATSRSVQKFLLAGAIGRIDFGNPYSRFSFGPGLAGGWDRWGSNNVRKATPDLAAFLGNLLRKQMQSGTLSEPLFSMWLHCVDPKKPESSAFFKELVKSPAYAKMDLAYHKLASHQMIFGSAALTDKSVTDPHVVSRELLNLPKGASPVQVAAAMKAVMTRVAGAREPVAVIGLHQVASLPQLDATTRTLALALFDQLSPLGAYQHRQGYEQLALRLIKEMRESGQWGKIVPYAASLWRSANTPDDNTHDHRAHYVEAALLSYAEAALAAESFSVALSVARSGVRSGVPIGERMGRLNSVAGKAMVALGVVDITVDETDVAYGLHKSNSEFIQGNLDSAWKLYEANANLLIPKDDEAVSTAKPLLRKLSVEYLFWLVKRTIEEDRPKESEELVKALTIWSREESGLLSIMQQGELQIAYADLAYRKGKLPTARAWYRKVADAREFKGSDVHVRAALGAVTVDRVSQNYGPALAELDKLMLINNPVARTKVHYAKAEVLMDQENFKDALADIDSVLRRDANHEDAKILKGKVEILMRRLVEATEIELGVSREDKVMVPGEVLKVNLLDPTLSVSGVGADIEIEVWAKSGDRERVMLHQLGDNKEKFRADVPTALAPPVAGDKTLQVLGEDEIRYGYSKRFRAKMKDLPPDPKTVITIAADAHLQFSAGAFAPRKGERKLSIEELGLSSAQAKLGTRMVRPGNPVYVRVIDPDQSKTARIDEVAVRLETSSGDVIRRLLLKETGPYTGEFEGVIPTTGAQASAFASEMAPGRDPNMAISAKAYPGWLGNVGDKGKMRTFGVDFNDNVPLGKMSVKWLTGEQRVTHFVLQTSLNGQDWVTRARYPMDGDLWDGRPQVTSIPTYRGGIPVSKPRGAGLPADWKEKMDLSSVGASCGYLSAKVPNLTVNKLPMVNTGHPGYSGLMRFRALFYQPDMVTRTFQLTGYPRENTVFLIDGVAADGDAEDPLIIERVLTPGLHEIQVWRHDAADKLAKAKAALLCNVPGKDGLTPCRDSMFDPNSFPPGVRAMIPQSASVTPVTGGIDVAFGDTTQARLVRLSILGFTGVAPGIRSVSLTGRDGKSYLPVRQDFMALRDNKQLEVLPGDQIVARYEDPVSATPKRTKHAQTLGVAFNTASISASFLNYETTSTGRRLKLEPIRRFNLEDAVAIVVDDVDMDGGPKRDVIEFMAVTSSGQKTKLKAVETDVHSGQFVGRIFPVTSKPQRESELQVPEGGTLTLIYRDMENLNPGIPTDRKVTIEHAKYMTPKLGAYTTTSAWVPQPKPAAVEVAKPEAQKRSRSKQPSGPEVFQPRRTLAYNYVDESKLDSTPLKTVIGGTVRFDVLATHLALAGSSEIVAYVQTDAGRRLADEQAKDRTPGTQPFDIMVPGTIKLTGRLGGGGSGDAPRGYKPGEGTGHGSGKSGLDEGRFSFAIPLILGDRPARSFATVSEESKSAAEEPEGLAVRAGDTVHIAYAWKDEREQIQWKTARMKVGSHAFLDVMNKGYNAALGRVFVGEKVFVRVLAPGLDRGPERDWTSVNLKGTSGASASFKLRETESHTGIFKGVFQISYADTNLPSKLPPVELNGFPVRYGDEVTVSYAATDEDPEQQALVAINMGADGDIEPFSKRFTGDQMAVKTSFTLSECFFELAKKHRKMDQESLARREMAHAKKLLQEALATHRDDDLRAHAEYLLGNLAQEYADLSQNDESKLPMYQDALARFSKIPIDYPETEFANKAQFKTGLVYEKIGESEIAVEEYVKLAYKYPNSEHIPEVMSRLGRHFQKTGQTFKEQADPLREKTDIESQAEVLRLDELSFPSFVKAAIIYGKLQQRFPDNKLAGLAGLASAQNYMRAHQYEKAITKFQTVVDTEEYEDNSIRAQALYWMGLCYERIAAMGQRVEGGGAYEIYRRTTFDFPDSKWAKYARGRLADPVFAKTIELEEKKREALLEALKAQKIKRSNDKRDKSVMDKLLKR